ncbi:MAG TPA: carboxypeptidase regulatory-like domain-containing protein, partial [Gemmatimonas sp.]|nr:carboxypeptidase regulatory-like domain-containing protein [Gemmatimonas sp.]
MILLTSSARALRSSLSSAVVLLTVVSTSLAAQQNTGTVAGRVSGPDGNAIPGATVTVVGSPITSTTDRSGIFRMSGVPAGAQRVLVRSLGKKPSERAVTVPADGTASVVVPMELASTQIAGITVT